MYASSSWSHRGGPITESISISISTFLTPIFSSCEDLHQIVMSGQPIIEKPGAQLTGIDLSRRNKKPRVLSEAERDRLDEFIDSIHYSPR